MSNDKSAVRDMAMPLRSCAALAAFGLSACVGRRHAAPPDLPAALQVYPGPNARAVAWLLLRATTNTGSGMFTHITSIQRLHTRGGKPPQQACDSTQLNRQVGTAYTGDYVFYVAAS